jgi:hypothetical protein
MPVCFRAGSPTLSFAAHPTLWVAVQSNKERTMSISTTTPAASSPAIDADVMKFKNAIIDMDALSQGGFSKISSIARLSLAALEAPSHPRQDEDIANALTAIWSIADDIKNCINSRAEDVGANYIDDGLRRRRAATARTPLADGGAA